MGVSSAKQRHYETSINDDAFGHNLWPANTLSYEWLGPGAIRPPTRSIQRWYLERERAGAAWERARVVHERHPTSKSFVPEILPRCPPLEVEAAGRLASSWNQCITGMTSARYRAPRLESAC